MWSFVRGFEDVDVPTNPIGHAEIEIFTDMRGNIVLHGAAWKAVNVKLPSRCEKTEEGWRGYAGKQCYETKEECKTDEKPDHVIALNKGWAAVWCDRAEVGKRTWKEGRNQMFESKPTTTPNDVTIAAASGHSIFFFAPAAEMKPSALALAELLATQLFPVTAWRIRNDQTEPLTIAAPPAGVTTYLFSAGRIYRLGDQPYSWNKKDQWEAALLFEWMQQRPKEPKVQSAPLKPGDPVAIISRSGYF